MNVINTKITLDLKLLSTFLISVVFFSFKDAITSDINPEIVTLGLFITMILCSFSILENANCVANIVGEPYGTLFLTLALTIIEAIVLIASFKEIEVNPNLLKDTAISIFMLSVAFFPGISLIVGGLAFGRQRYNVSSADAYLAILGFLTAVCLTLPGLISANGALSPELSILVSVVSILSYAVFLYKQTVSHVDYFVYENRLIIRGSQTQTKGELFGSLFCCCIGIVLLSLLSEDLSISLIEVTSIWNLPKELIGLMVATTVLLPEGISAIKSAANNRLQTSINLCLGCSISTLSLTIPCVLLYAVYVQDFFDIIIELTPAENLFLYITLFLNKCAFSSKETGLVYGVLLLNTFVLYIATFF